MKKRLLITLLVLVGIVFVPYLVGTRFPAGVDLDIISPVITSWLWGFVISVLFGIFAAVAGSAILDLIFWIKTGKRRKVGEA